MGNYLRGKKVVFYINYLPRILFLLHSCRSTFLCGYYFSSAWRTSFSLSHITGLLARILFFYLEMFLFHLSPWRIFSLDIKFWVDRSFNNCKVLFACILWAMDCGKKYMVFQILIPLCHFSLIVFKFSNFFFPPAILLADGHFCFLAVCLCVCRSGFPCVYSVYSLLSFLYL